MGVGLCDGGLGSVMGARVCGGGGLCDGAREEALVTPPTEGHIQAVTCTCACAHTHENTVLFFEWKQRPSKGSQSTFSLA